MHHRTIVAAIAAGSLLLGNAAAFAQGAERNQELLDQQQRLVEQQQRDRAYPPGDPRRSDAPVYRNEPRTQQRDSRDYHRGDARDDQRYEQRDQRYDQRYDQQRYDPRYYQRWDHREQRYYPADRWGGEWRGHGAGPNHDWYRGSYLPREYRSHHYVVDDWRGHHLYAPPSGYHWVQAPGGDYLLVAVATGLIASILLNQ